MQQKIIYISTVLLLIVILLTYYFIPKLNDKNNVNNALYEDSQRLFEKFDGPFSPNIIMDPSRLTHASIRESMRLDISGNFEFVSAWRDARIQKLIDNNSTINLDGEIVGKWNDGLVRLQSALKEETKNGVKTLYPEELLLFSRDAGETWVEINRSSKDICGDYGVIYNDKIFCFLLNNRLSLNIISENTGIENAGYLSSRRTDAFEILAIYREDNNVTVIWEDERSRFPTWYAFLPIPHSAETKWGPYVVMRGDINLDTIEFQENIIKYNSNIFP